ncbi:uncharacterized protein [Narcine bancroftii]|uniref:uncharacterized protein n=1 Tax=Narcine bancroftii TaxID=1343680 RepID=UPI003831AC07
MQFGMQRFAASLPDFWGDSIHTCCFATFQLFDCLICLIQGGSSTEEVLGFSSRKNKDWFDENSQEIQELLAKKRAAHQAHLTKPSCPEKKQAFRRACSHLQRKLREIQNEWWTSLAKRTQLSADIGDFRGFYEALKAVYGPSPQVQSPLRSSDGKVLLSDKISILNRWSEHFQSLFSTNRSVQDSALLQLPQQPLRLELDEVPTLDETYILV